MKLLGIFDLFFIQDFYGENGTDWAAIIVGAILSALVAWMTVSLTLYYQKKSENEKQNRFNSNRRSTIIEINKKIHKGYCNHIKHLKKGIRKNFFGSNSFNAIHTFNTLVYNHLDRYDIEDLLEATTELSFDKQERLLLINYKLSVTSIKQTLDSLSLKNDENAREIERIAKDTDLHLTEVLPEIQNIVYKHDGLKILLKKSLLFPGLLVITDKNLADLFNLVHSLDHYIIKYQRNYFKGSIRIHQLILLKGLLKTLRKYQNLKIVDVRIAQKISTGIEMIKKEKIKYNLHRKTNENHAEILKVDFKRFEEFSRLLRSKHQKYSTKQNKKSIFY
ncbi:hypothetical protein [Sphingobacterium lactis]|uniref:Phage abortive infection protein n=1 Tax=Sphingobacterium lactis TaxID=797291 RepID=A0A1H6BQH8_9SPHI|nr:hypothetical protein [Sphingobacterium lactis]SEG62961.1 hypothetical protein SAMN05421877_11163 [Sphingobacterium lactis]